MVLIDTSVWIDHLRRGNPKLQVLLTNVDVACHPFVIGELACGNLRKRDEVLRLLNDLPQAPVASYEEVLHFIESYKLMGQGVGYIDTHLLASAALADTALLWTRDQRLQKIARKLKLAFD